MKRILYATILTFLLGSVVIGCSPAASPKTFAGAWATNVGKVNLMQEDNKILGSIEGYGGSRNETFGGTINANGEADFSTTWFGDFTLVLGDNTFKSKSSELSFCGIRGTDELPSGCGFSGKWIVPSKSVFLDGSYMVLKQVGENVTGDLFDGNNKSYDSFTGKVEWGKGWMMVGTSPQRGEVTFWINAAETGFQIVHGNAFDQQLCAVRDGQPSAYIMSFTCEP